MKPENQKRIIPMKQTMAEVDLKAQYGGRNSGDYGQTNSNKRNVVPAQSSSVQRLIKLDSALMQYGTMDAAKRHASSKNDIASADLSLNNYQKVQSKIRTRGDELKQTYMNPAFGPGELKQTSALNSHRGSNSMAEKRYSKPNNDLEESGVPKFGAKILGDNTKNSGSMPSTQRYDADKKAQKDPLDEHGYSVDTGEMRADLKSYIPKEPNVNL